MKIDSMGIAFFVLTAVLFTYSLLTHPEGKDSPIFKTIVFILTWCVVSIVLIRYRRKKN